MGLEQREFARLLDISQSTYSRYEKGRSEPPLGLVYKLVEVYDFPAYLLFYKNVDDFISNLPLNLISFCLFENNFDYDPLRAKPTGRKHNDMIEDFSEILSLIGQVKKRYEMYSIDEFMSYFDVYKYDSERVLKVVQPIAKAYGLKGL